MDIGRDYTELWHHQAQIREEEAWVVYRGAHPHPTAQASMPPETAWKLLFNALQPGEAGSAIASSGNQDLITRMLDVRGVMV